MSIVPFPLPSRDEHTRAVVAAAWLILPISFGTAGLAAWYWARERDEWERNQARDMMGVSLCVGVTLAIEGAIFVALVVAGLAMGSSAGLFLIAPAWPLFLWINAMLLGFASACVLQAIHTLDPVERVWPAAEEFVDTVVIPRLTKRRGLLVYWGARVPTAPSTPVVSE